MAYLVELLVVTVMVMVVVNVGLVRHAGLGCAVLCCVVSVVELCMYAACVDLALPSSACPACPACPVALLPALFPICGGGDGSAVAVAAMVG